MNDNKNNHNISIKFISKIFKFSKMKRELNEDNKISIESSTTDNKHNTGETVSKICRLGKCEVCAANEAKYTCPKCQVKTCGLACVQIHKKELDCNGIRDRTKFIPLRKMTEMDFMSDYYFLEECVRYTQDRKRDPLKRFTRYNKELPAKLFRLRKMAAERGTTLRFLLHNFSRHKENTTYYDGQQRKIFWRVEWIFVNSNSAKYIDEHCDENLTLYQLVDKYINIKCTENVPKKELLQYYQTGAPLKILLKAEGVKRSRNRYYCLDASKSLKQNLYKKTLVEFPIIYISYEVDTAGFDIIDSDEDVEAETKAYQVYLDGIKKKELEAMRCKAMSLKDVHAEDSVEETPCNSSEKPKQSSEEILKSTNNYLFTDERLLDVLSSDDGAETE